MDAADLGGGWVVVLGASAGGLEPILRLLSKVPVGSELAVVVAQHLSPSHESLLSELLGRVSTLPVREATDGMTVRAGQVHVVPPNRDAELVGGRIVLHPVKPGPGPKPSINRLFRSLAAVYGERAVGVVLSGTGTDGAAGLLAVRAAGGVTVVQDPDAAEYDGMPRAAIDLGAVDVQLTVEEIATFLASLERGANAIMPASTDVTETLAALAARHEDFDLGRYRQMTVLRRLTRRMAVHGLTAVEDYLALCARQPGEVGELVRDLYINVTDFFRDPEHFSALRAHLADALPGGAEEVRVWVVGCATGEEAYTVALLLEDLRLSGQLGRPFQIFATDVNPVAIAVARRGVYPLEDIDGVPAHLREIGFHAGPSTAAVTARLREKVVFAVNDIGVDPPLSKVDLVTCRNMLIYFKPQFQERIFQLLHYALLPGGTLFLGEAEAAESAADLFTAVDETAKIYTKRDTRQPRPAVGGSGLRRRQLAIRQEAAAELPLEVVALRGLAAAHVPACLVLTPSDLLAWSRGDLGRWLRIAAGDATLGFFTMVPPGLRAHIRAAVARHRRALEHDPASPASTARLALDAGGWLILTIDGMGPDRPGWLRIDLDEVNPPTASVDGADSAGSAESDLFADMQSELQLTRSDLSLTVSELDYANEDLTAANEELQASNEELQSSNEELQTTNEELQSTNEELITLNDELNVRTLELKRSVALLEGVFDASSAQIVLLDQGLRVLTATPGIAVLTGCPVEAGASAAEVSRWMRHPQLLTEVTDALASATPSRGRLVAGGRRWTYDVTLIDGAAPDPRVMVTLIDVTEIEGLRITVDQDQGDIVKVLGAMHGALVRVGVDGSIDYANRQALDMLDAADLSAIVPDVPVMVDTDGKALTLRQLGALAADSEMPIHVEGRWSIDDEEGNWVMVAALPIAGPSTPHEVLISVRDVDGSKEAQQALRWAADHDPLTGLANRRAFEASLRAAATTVTRGARAVVLFVDVDGLKQINDLAGHPVGDQALKVVAAAIQEHTRHPDEAARLGGDEFAVLMIGTDADVGLLRAEEIRRAIETQRVHWSGGTLPVSVSIGVAAFDRNDPSGEAALARADTAVLHAKARGKNLVEIASHTVERHEQRLEQSRLSSLLAGPDLAARLHPEFDVIASVDGSDQTRRVELLARLRDGENLFDPEVFIPAAERSGAIRKVDRWALEQALALIDRTRGTTNAFRVHVNVSPASAGDRGFLDVLDTHLTTPGLAEHLAIELTETATSNDDGAVLRLIDLARSAGAEVFLDDFGRGFNSLTQLRNLRVDGLKIDGSLVRPLDHSATERAIVAAISTMAESLGLLTVAEHVESQAVATELARHPITYGQGDIYGRDLTADDAVNHLTQG